MTADFDPTRTTIGGIQDPISEMDLRIRLFDHALNHNQQHYNGIDIGRIGFIFRAAESHLYIANSLPEVVDIHSSGATLIDHLILNSVRYIQQRGKNDELLVGSRTTEALDMPGSPRNRLPYGLKEILACTAYTLDLLASSFGTLRSEAYTPDEKAKYTAWKQRTMQIKVDPAAEARRARNE